MSHTFVEDIMRKDLVSIDQAKPIKEAAILMDEKNVGCVIITHQNTPVGILTERDFVKRIAAKEKSLSSPLSEVMSSPLIIIKPGQTVWDAAEIMKVKNIHKLPVQENEKVLGIVTTSDLINVCSVGSDSEMRRVCDQILTRLQSSSSD